MCVISPCCNQTCVGSEPFNDACAQSQEFCFEALDKDAASWGLTMMSQNQNLSNMMSRCASVSFFASIVSCVGEYAGCSNITHRPERPCAGISKQSSWSVSLAFTPSASEHFFSGSIYCGSSGATLWQIESLMEHLSSSIRGNLKRSLTENEIRNGGCKLSKRSEKTQSPEEITLEQPGSMRLACVMESERADQVEFEGVQVRVYSANGKLEAEIAEREKAKNYKVIDVKKRLSETMNYDPSELQLSWGESNLEDDVLLISLGPELDLRVAVVIVRSQDIARQVQVASFKDIKDPSKCLTGAAIEQLSAIIEPVSAGSVEDIKCVARGLADRALSDETRHYEHYICLFLSLSNRWYRPSGALSERHVVKSLLDYTQDEWHRVISALTHSNCEGICSSPIMEERLMALTKFSGALFRYKLLHIEAIITILHDLVGLRTSCNAQACACELLQAVCVPCNWELGRWVFQKMWYGIKTDEMLNTLRSPYFYYYDYYDGAASR